MKDYIKISPVGVDHKSMGVDKEMIDIKKEVNMLLSEMERAMPGVSKHKAQSMPITHGNPLLEVDMCGRGGSLVKSVGQVNGVYIYHNKDKVYYIGKGKTIVSRLRCHFRESVCPVIKKGETGKMKGKTMKGLDGDWKYGDYPAFFRDKLGIIPLIITWVQIEEGMHGGEFRRKMVEAALTDQLRPEFVDFDKARKEGRKLPKKLKTKN